MIRIYVWLISAVFVLSVSGCVSTSGFQDGNGSSDRCLERGRAIAAAVVAGNYRDFLIAADEPEIIGDSKKFAESRKEMIRQFGTPEKFQHLVDLKTPLLVNQLWLIDFIRTDQKGKIVVQQQLFQLLWGEKDGKTQLLGMRFL